MDVKLSSINYHRNGVFGAGFHAITFTFRKAGQRARA
jgi:hypothetical protein